MDYSHDFLDIKMHLLSNGKIETSVYVKNSQFSQYSNYSSHTLQNYKLSVAKILIDRALKYSSSWQYFDSEIQRIRKILSVNGYPMSKIDNLIKKKLEDFSNKKAPNDSKVQIYVEFFNVSNFNSDKKKLTKILDAHVRCPDQNSSISLVPFYKPFKLSSVFSTRTKLPENSRNNVVYQYTCSQDRCKPSYVGYTTNALNVRVKQHRYKSSSIYQHLARDHSMLPPIFDQFVKDFKILYSFQDSLTLRIAEAIHIKNTNPFINVKYNELYDFLSLF